MNINLDSRTIKPGEIFIPVKGENFDGRDFIGEVTQKGGRVLDVNLQDYAKKYRKKLNCSVIGVTGSAGKTTIKDMLYFILSQRFNVVRTRENENNEIGVPLTLLRANAETDILIVEMGIRKPKDMKILTQMVRPTHVIITGVGQTHREFFKSQKQIAIEKSSIFQKKLQWEQDKRVAYLNFSSPFYTLQKERAESSGYTVYPFEGRDRIDQSMNLVHKVSRAFGISDIQIQTGLKKFKPSANRLTVFKENGFLLIDDSYNSNPDGLSYALSYLRQFTGRKIFISGDMLELGDASESEHAAIPDLALDAEVSYLLTIGKESSKIKSTHIPHRHFNEQDALYQHIRTTLKKGDVILVKGSRSLRLDKLVEKIKKCRIA